MNKDLIIVESPAKSETIRKYLNNNFKVLASYGHVRDLMPKENSIDIKNNFKMNYEIVRKNEKYISSIKEAAKSATLVYLATDPDREGEAIAWHIYEILKKENYDSVKNKRIYRIVFNEITKKAINDALNNPRRLLKNLINAQQARRTLDFLVGFKLSPLLWKKIRKGLSAGRVQSPALRMIVEREKRVDSFKKQEYWTINAKINETDLIYPKLTKFNSLKLEKFYISNKKQAKDIIDTINRESNYNLMVDKVCQRKRKKFPEPPFTTSTIQQESVKKLGFTTKKTMMIAQQLYEGVNLEGGETTGLITYIRTDSTNLASEAIDEIREFIKSEYNKDQLSKEVNIYKTKNKNAQEAHEAIRPTSIFRKPKNIKHLVSEDHYKIYNIIWERTVACQMVNATFKNLVIEFATENNYHIFKMTEQAIEKYGFLLLSKGEKQENLLIPKVKKGDKIQVEEFISKQHFTEPPSRYNEASLVKKLEEHNIGRPSTYVSIISTLKERSYVDIDKKYFRPTDIGMTANKFLTNYFKKYVDYKFTSNLEKKLDYIAEGKKDLLPVLKEFWEPFFEKIKYVEKNVKKSDIVHEKLKKNCPQCNEHLIIKLGKSGKFISCSNYPECKYTKSLTENNQDDKEKIEINKGCPLCESKLVLRKSKYGKFIGCTSYPKCKHLERYIKDIGVKCPACKLKNFFEKTSRKGKIFYSCGDYPNCKTSYWDKPIDKKCKKCQSSILLERRVKKTNNIEEYCPSSKCNHSNK